MRDLGHRASGAGQGVRGSRGRVGKLGHPAVARDANGAVRATRKWMRGIHAHIIRMHDCMMIAGVEVDPCRNCARTMQYHRNQELTTTTTVPSGSRGAPRKGSQRTTECRAAAATDFVRRKNEMNPAKSHLVLHQEAHEHGLIALLLLDDGQLQQASQQLRREWSDRPLP